MTDARQKWLTNGLGALMLLGGISLVFSLLYAWPTRVVSGENGSTGTAQAASVVVGWENRWGNKNDSAVLVFVICMSALGGYVHMATSFATYAGNRTLEASWVWWYVLRIVIGVALSVIFYTVMRGGLLAGNAPSSAVSPYGFAAVAGLVGMFSKQATDKLRELFDTLFRVEKGGDNEREDKLLDTAIENIDPARVPLNTTQRLRVFGKNFSKNSVVMVGGQEQQTTFVTAQELTVELAARTAPGKLEVRVRQGMLVSDAVSLVFGEPEPENFASIGRLEPAQVKTGMAANMQVHGTGFTAESVVIAGDEEIKPRFVDPRLLSFELPSRAVPGNIEIKVRQGGVTSRSVVLKVVPA